MIIILLVVTLSSAMAGNKLLTQKEIDVLAENTVGLLNGGVRIVEIKKEDFKNQSVATINTDVSFFNTMSIPQDFSIYTEPFEIERTHIIKKDYIFHLLPNLNWITVPDKITVEPMSKYIMPVTVNMPLEEGFEKAKGGGFICYITASRVGVESVHSHKLFLVLEEETSALKLGFDPIYLVSVAVVGGVVAVALVIRKRRSEYYEDEYEDDYEYETY